MSVKTILIIIAVGSGNGTGVSVDKIRYGTEENCLEAASQINKYDTKKVYGEIEAICIDGGDILPKKQ